MIHALITLAIQLTAGWLTGNWWLSGLLMVAFYFGREFTQAEYRYMSDHDIRRRLEMPLLAGFYPEAWNQNSVLDWVLPLVIVVIVLLTAQL